jgi:ADP-heptose:LPS heptosyltransferase
VARDSYDLVLDLQGLFRSGFLAWATRAPQRIGFADAREGGWLGYTRRIRVPRDTHHIDRYLMLLEQIGIPPIADLRLYPGAAAESKIASDPDLAGKRFIILAPTTRGLGRAWPIERYADLARRLIERSHQPGIDRLAIDRICIVGLASEREYCKPLLDAMQNTPMLVDRIGATSLQELMSLIARAALVVCNDSAAMHLAVAFDRPLIALLGPTRIDLAGPYRRPEDVITHRTTDPTGADAGIRHRDVARASEIMRRIGVDEVLVACERRLKRSGK